MQLTKVTITGVDESCEPYDLCRLFDEFPFVEFGVLVSSSKEGREARYPSPEWIDNAMERMHPVVPLAAHLCGSWCRDAINGSFAWAIQRNEQFRRFHRFQFNGAGLSEQSVFRLGEYMRLFRNQEFILQAENFARPFACGEREPARLLDLSGGRGIELTEFPPPAPLGFSGYAGGFGPDNLDAVLAKLTAMPSNKPFWVDMETKVRTDERLDMNKVRECLLIAKAWIKG